MCGLSGLLNLQGQKHFGPQLKLMADQMIHRGPDAVGFYTDAFCGFAHRRLKIIDQSDKANQPMRDDSGDAVIVFNGEIYNYKDLKSELESENIIFTTESDTEVLLKGLIKHGVSFISKLEGDFSFAFRSIKKNIFLLARDRFGVKPLYISRTSDALYFSSEIKPLFATGIEKKINLEQVAEYFKYRYVMGNETLFKNISQFPPGHFLLIENGVEVLKKYYSPAGAILETQDTFAGLFRKAVADRLNSDVKVGLFLSSGVDSNAIAAQVDQLKNKVFCFSYSFADKNSSLDESSFAELSAKQYNFSFQKIEEETDLFKHYPRILSNLEEPIGDSIILANDTLFKEGKKIVGVCFVGEGADEIFSSYAHHKVIRIFQFLKSNYLFKFLALKLIKYIPLVVINKFSFYPAKFSDEIKSRLTSALNSKTEQELYDAFATLFDQDEIIQLLNFKPAFAPNIFDEDVQLNDIKNWLPKYSLLRIDKLSMAYSLEIRTPYLSHHIVEYCLNSRQRKFLRLFNVDKKMFRHFCKKSLNLTKAISYKKKLPFFSPVNFIPDSELEKYIRTTLSKTRINKFSILNYDYIEKLLNSETKDFIWMKKINCILIFQIWCEVFFSEEFGANENSLLERKF